MCAYVDGDDDEDAADAVFGDDDDVDDDADGDLDDYVDDEHHDHCNMDGHVERRLYGSKWVSVIRRYRPSYKSTIPLMLTKCLKVLQEPRSFARPCRALWGRVWGQGSALRFQGI